MFVTVRMRMRDNCSVLQHMRVTVGMSAGSLSLYELRLHTVFLCFHKILSSCNLPLISVFLPLSLSFFYIDRHRQETLYSSCFYRIFLPADLHINLLIWDLNLIFTNLYLISSVIRHFAENNPAVLPGMPPEDHTGVSRLSTTTSIFSSFRMAASFCKIASSTFLASLISFR